MGHEEEEGEKEHGPVGGVCGDVDEGRDAVVEPVGETGTVVEESEGEVVEDEVGVAEESEGEVVEENEGEVVEDEVGVAEKSEGEVVEDEVGVVEESGREAVGQPVWEKAAGVEEEVVLV